jgi:hypothetical protein
MAEQLQTSGASSASFWRPEFASGRSGLIGLDRVGNRGHRLLAVTRAAFKGPKLKTLFGGLNRPKLHLSLATLTAWALEREQAGERIR